MQEKPGNNTTKLKKDTPVTGQTEYPDPAKSFLHGPFADRLDDRFMIAGEMVEGKGEDSFYSAFSGRSAVAAVFDGCGGLGSRRYPGYARHTGAYMASRAACSAMKSWFEKTEGGTGTGIRALAEDLKAELRNALEICLRHQGETSRILGSMVRDFPTTAAIALVREKEDGPGDVLQVCCYWAGDSRVYLLDGRGLAQLTTDDLRGAETTDALDNLHQDAPLSNCICAGQEFTLHARQIDVKGPFAVFSASDGCFGYLPSPFHFEDLLLSSLQQADSPEDFEQRVESEIREYAGDDYTMGFLNFGYGDFFRFREALADRARQIQDQYIAPLRDLSEKEAGEQIRQLWEEYRNGYERLLKEKSD